MYNEQTHDSNNFVYFKICNTFDRCTMNRHERNCLWWKKNVRVIFPSRTIPLPSITGMHYNFVKSCHNYKFAKNKQKKQQN